MDNAIKAIQALLALLDLAGSLGVRTDKLLSFKAKADAEGREISPQELAELMAATDEAREQALKS